MLDELDKNIIFELEKNGRVTSTEIAKKLNVSLLTVTRRMNVMFDESRNVAVKGLPDPAKMGWVANGVAVIKCRYDKIEIIIDHLKAIFNVNHIAALIGEYNLIAFLGERTWDNMHAHFCEIRSLDGIIALDTYCIANTQKRHVFGDDGFAFGRLQPGEKPYNLDEIDKKIVNELIDDGRISFAKLAGKVNEPLSIVRRRTLALLEDNVIKVQPIIDINQMLDVRMAVFVFIRCEQNLIAENTAYLKSCQEIVMVMTLTNNADLLFSLQAVKPEALDMTLNKHLNRLKGVFNTQIYFRSEIKKRYYFKDLKNEITSLAAESNGKTDT